MNFEVAVFTCARCGEDHTMVFSEFSEKPIECDGKVYSHYGTCPNTGEPVILAIVPAGAGEEEPRQ